ncbi:MAG TPA: lysylphosphatidylglycerol synthase domain-containing protein [Rhodanobacteraceae bacterium]|nr:lysylphosphatidylglycerol synthase domain-containing protein [Rhodanobacteraceae bacterium]
MTVDARRILRTIGLLLSAAAVTWIALRFVQSGALDLLQQASISKSRLIVALLVLALGYAAAAVLLAFAWWRLIRALASDRAVPAAPTMAAYAVSQYGKYLPGNVAHYAIRHAWIRRHGIPHASLGLASILEAALLVLSALALTLVADTRGLRVLSILDPRAAIALLVAILTGLGIALHALRHARFLGRYRLPSLPPLQLLLLCLVCYCGFFVLAAGCLGALAHALAIPVDSFALLLAASAASWLAGFIVIGAPGGLGVREAAFVALTGAALGESRALLLIGLFRVVTFLGDTLSFAAGALLARATDGAAASAAVSSSNPGDSS